MKFEWNECSILKLINFYGYYESLRNPQHPDYYDRQCRLETYQKIVFHMKITSLTPDQCVHKINDLKKDYCYELAKIGSAMCQGKTYKPKSKWFNPMHKLLFPTAQIYKEDYPKIKKEKQLSKTLCIANNHNVVRKPKCQIFTTTKTNLQSHTHDVSCEIEAFPIKYSKNECRVSIDTGINTISVKCIENGTQTEKCIKKSKWTDCEGLQNEHNNVEQLKILTATDCKRKKKKVRRDEFDIFGENIACQLRNLELDNALMCEKQIQDMISNKRIDKIKNVSKCSRCKENCREK